MVLPTNIIRHPIAHVRYVILDAQLVQLLVWPILVILVMLPMDGLKQTKMPVQPVLNPYFVIKMVLPMNILM